MTATWADLNAGKMTTFLFTGATSGENAGKLTVEQFSQLVSAMLGAAAGPVSLMCSFIDTDNDGLISPEDILLAEARIRQRNPDFLKIIFRVYVDAVWYPGRNLNQANAYLSGMVGSWAAGVKNAIQGTETSGAAIFEPPKFITGNSGVVLFIL